jgi:regulatory protein
MLTISSIKAAQKRPNQVWLTFSDSSFIPFFIDDVVKLSLAKSQEVDDEKFNLIINTCLLFLGREYSLRQIAISPKTEKIINQKLKLFFRKTILRYKINSNNLNSDEVGRLLIQELKDKKLLNEADFIAYFVKRNYKKSRQQIIYSLQQLGVNSSHLSSLDINSKSEVDKIKDFLIKKKVSKSNLTDFKEKNKIKASLYRRGFNLSDINAAIDDCLNSR